MESTEQQLALISEMINTARKQFSDNSFIYLLWGWAVAIAALAEFVLIKAEYEEHPIVWLITIPVATVGQVVFLARRKKKEQAVSHMDKVMGYLWMSVGASMVVVLASMSIMRLSTYPVLILLYGIGTFISGAMMNLKPMQVGAVCCWVIGAVAFHVTFEYQLLLLSLSLILSYIIPGHILQNRFRKQHV